MLKRGLGVLCVTFLLGGCDDDGGSEEPPPLEPGSFQSPLVQLQRLQGEEDHMHVDEVRLRDDGKLAYCSYTFGVVDAADAADMEYLSQNLTHTVPDDERTPGCIHLAWDGDFVYTTHRGNIRNPTFLSGWDVSDPEMPAQLPALQEPGISYEGIDVSNGRIFVGLKQDGLGVYQRRADGDFERIGTAAELADAWGVAAAGDTVFVADGAAGLVTVDASDPTNPVVVGSVATGGQARGVAVDGDIVYVAAGSAGVVVVDAGDLAAPIVIGRAEVPGSAIRVAHSEGRIFVAAWNDTRVYDVSDPTAPRFIGAVRLTQDDDIDDPDRPAPTARTLGVAARGDDVFVGNWWVLYSYRLYADRLAPNIRLPEAALTTDFGPVPLDETRSLPIDVTNQGTAPLTLIQNSVFGDSFSVEPQQARLAPGETLALTVTYTPRTTKGAESGYLTILSDDPAAPVRTVYMVGNQPGLGVGKKLPETTAVLLDGTPWSSSQTEGKVLLLAYFATF